LFGLQIHQRRLWPHLGHDRAWLVTAETAQPFEANGRPRPTTIGEALVDIASGARINVANESQRDVIVLGLEPARPDDSAAHERKLTNDGVRQFEAGEQARHPRFPLTSPKIVADLRDQRQLANVTRRKHHSVTLTA
jgi:hypothetical protein